MPGVSKETLLRDAEVAFGVESDEASAQQFLSAHPWLLNGGWTGRLRLPSTGEIIPDQWIGQFSLPEVSGPDFVRTWWTPSRGWSWEFIKVESPASVPLHPELHLGPELTQACARVRELSDYARQHWAAVDDFLHDSRRPFRGRVIVGRTSLLKGKAADHWKTCDHGDLRVQTYDPILHRLRAASGKAMEAEEAWGKAVEPGALKKRRQTLLESPNFGDERMAVEEIEGLLRVLEDGEFTRADAVRLHNRVYVLRPDLLSHAKRVREVAHDLDGREPNVSGEDLRSAIQVLREGLGGEG